MEECPLLHDCPFFQHRMENMPISTELLKSRFCRGDYGSCARYVVYCRLGRDGVPLDLFPNEPKRARRFLSSAPPVSTGKD